MDLFEVGLWGNGRKILEPWLLCCWIEASIVVPEWVVCEF